MGILRVILQNLEHKARTRRPDEPVPYPEGYRGMLCHEVDRCVGCKMCAYVCSPGAIAFDEEGDQFITWKYFAEQCTFCGRCVDYCPASALSFEQKSPVVTGDRAQHRVVHHVPYQTCTRCGRPMLPMPDFMLARLYGEPLSEEIVELGHLCQECRRRVIGSRVKCSFGGDE